LVIVPVIELLPVEIVTGVEPSPKLQPLRVKLGKIEPTTPFKVALGKNDPNDKGATDETDEEITLELITELEIAEEETTELEAGDDETDEEIMLDETTELDRIEDEA
jgi:hypothetical protein